MLEQYEQALDEWIATKVADGDDDQLFASGYLQGHVAVVLSELELETLQDSEALEAKMQACLETAKSELEPADLALVVDAWSELREKMAQVANA
ncbi:YfcL family protein [Shewanella insulae]|uniref:YfcL family protein n=1 Tax=Shewanella insulae TaxID=2681496 RepID=A0A6L7HXQ1_9GAMM|nr:YfcL family protein [Shewanella insulae]MCG9714101.1 YfcL family protein [Shewanella insulae]MCG9737219.1 YfcL family protein [Shewanella insulae]MCG9757082.1 YfcL family protein [Shewanella insulae]MXR69097.1 YfcL family protein [Shewanella insulae]